MSAFEYRRMNAEQALKLIFSALEQDRPYTLFDVRDAHTFGHGHVPGAVQLGEHDVGSWLGKLPRTQPLFIYCGLGFSSQTFAKRFADFGFSEVYSIDGGFPAIIAALKQAREAALGSEQAAAGGG
jgi:thiosulfate sulfurtransferase